MIPEEFKINYLLSVTECFEDFLQESSDLEINEHEEIAHQFYEILQKIQITDPNLWEEFNEKTFPFFQEIILRFFHNTII